MWNRVVLFAVLLVGILLPLPGQAQADAKPSNLTVTFRLQAPLTAVRFANGAVDGVSLVGGGLGLQWKEFWMVEGGGGLSFWPKNSEAAINYEAHFRAGIAPIVADGRVEGSGWVLQAQLLGEIQYLLRAENDDGIGRTEKTTGLSLRMGLEASRWSKKGSAFTTRLSVGSMMPLQQTRDASWRGWEDLHWAMDVALDFGIASH
jgi:hypothetical protein